MIVKAPFLIETPKRIIGFGKLSRWSFWYVWTPNKRIVQTITVRNHWIRVQGKDVPRGEVRP